MVTPIGMFFKIPAVTFANLLVLILLISHGNGSVLHREERGLIDSLGSLTELRQIVGEFGNKAKDFLQNYGWLPSINPETFKEAGTKVLRKAIRLFQRFYGLQETGVVDEPTRQLMETPRCGVRDNLAAVDTNSEKDLVEAGDQTEIYGQSSTRNRRYIIQKTVQYGQKWKRRDLKYRINQYTKKVPSSVVDGVFRKAFYEWQKVSPFTIELKESGPVHIDIKFEPGDGPGQALAYAYGPGPGIGGDMRFDEWEEWTVRTEQGQNLYMVALHEIGHVFGLDHSNTPGAIMNPYYSGYIKGKSLQPDDIAGIQAIYGSPNAPPVVPTAKPVNGASGKARRNKLIAVYGNNVCDIQDGQKVIDGITITQDKRMYAFKGKYFFELKPESATSDLHPEPISQGWIGLPETIDTVFTGPEGYTFFFKGDQFWKFRNRQMQPGYPRPITQGFPGVPSNLDAVFIYSVNKRIYFIKGDQYWRFEPGSAQRVAEGYPKSLKEWKKLPNKIDAAVTWRDGRTYFFSGKNYYKFDDFKFAVEDGYPKPVTTWWFACEDVDNERPENNGENGVAEVTDASI